MDQSLKKILDEPAQSTQYDGGNETSELGMTSPLKSTFDKAPSPKKHVRSSSKAMAAGMN